MFSYGFFLITLEKLVIFSSWSRNKYSSLPIIYRSWRRWGLGFTTVGHRLFSSTEKAFQHSPSLLEEKCSLCWYAVSLLFSPWLCLIQSCLLACFSSHCVLWFTPPAYQETWDKFYSLGLFCMLGQIFKCSTPIIGAGFSKMLKHPAAPIELLHLDA